MQILTENIFVTTFIEFNLHYHRFATQCTKMYKDHFILTMKRLVKFLFAIMGVHSIKIVLCEQFRPALYNIHPNSNKMDPTSVPRTPLTLKRIRSI